MHQPRHRFVSIAVLFLVMITMCACAPESGPVDLDIRLEMEVGKDIGQSLGTLFTLEDGAGNVVMGAGFPDVYNSSKRVNPRNLNVFIETDRPGTFETIPRPFPDTTAIRLMNVNGDLIALNLQDTPDAHLKKLEADGTWSGYTTTIPTGNIVSLNNDLLEIGQQDIIYSGDSIIDNPRSLTFLAYYVDGRMVVYSRDEQALYVCPWEYDDPDPVDLDACEQYELPYDNDQFPYSFGTFEDELLFNMNHGDRYSYAGGALTLIDQNDGSSNQIYTLLHGDGYTYAGHFPTGSILVYDGEGSYRAMTPNVSVPDGFPENHREAQSLQLYAGYMYTGIWPNAELHQYDFDDDSWVYLRRLFSHPDVPGPSGDEPYVDTITNLELPVVYNAFGQRLNDLEIVDEYMYIALSNKAGAAYDESWGFLTPEQLAEYGSVVRYQKDYNLACQFHWPEDGETAIRVTLADSDLTIYQDSAELCSLSVDLTGITIDESTLSLGEGIFGSYGGADLTQSIDR
jgi:hypothetical protein